jgi:arabinofuranosyltransferase
MIILSDAGALLRKRMPLLPIRAYALRLLAWLAWAAPIGALLVAGFDHRWMDDDGFINLRVARNLLDGNGPVFNLGERVEAVTSPLWVAVLAAFGALRFRLEDAAVAVGIAFSCLGVALAQSGAARLQAGFRQKPFRLGFVPFGTALYVALPPAWDYATAGLEVGLSLAWLGASFLVGARAATAGPKGWRLSRGTLASAVLVGLGPVVRPELALYAPVPLLLLAIAVARSSSGGRFRLAAVTSVVASAGALPLAYQVFRMGYYASAMPNTALAKEAMLTNVAQGKCYFDNFVDIYKLTSPFTVAAAAWLVVLAACVWKRRWLALVCASGPPVLAALHAHFVVRMGGDYMHGRMLLPPAFAALMPVAVLGWPVERWRLLIPCAVAWALLLTWMVPCVRHLRMGEDNVCDIGEERGWYARSAKFDNPVRLDDYRQHPFYGDGTTARDRIQWLCPSAFSGRRLGSGEGCRQLHLTVDEQKEVASPTPGLLLADDVSPRLGGVISAGAIGMLGYMLPSNLYVVDRHGLADPITARRFMTTRGRPGHEKTMPAWWMVARFASPRASEDATITAARHALHCGALGGLERGVTAPVTPSLFVDNVLHAVEYGRLRVPADPFEAESMFCGTPVLERSATLGGGGGAPLHRRCPSGMALTGLRGQYSDGDHAIGSLQALCRSSGGTSAEGAMVGDGSGTPFSVECPAGEPVVGLRLGAAGLVRSVGLVCGEDGETSTAIVGDTSSIPARIACTDGLVAVGIVGRSGALIDQLGVECSKARTGDAEQR